MTGLGSSCGACKFLRRRCTSECVFAPYFCYEQAASHFAAVHKVFGASNVSKLLLHLPVYSRSDAAITISYEALSRMQDPIYGCIAHIFALQQQVAGLKEEIEMIGTQMTNLGFGIGNYGEFQDAISNNPYFVAQSGVSENSNNQLSSSMLRSGNNNAVVDETCCNNMELRYEDTISQAYLDSNILKRLIEEVNQDCCVHALD